MQPEISSRRKKQPNPKHFTYALVAKSSFVTAIQGIQGHCFFAFCQSVYQKLDDDDDDQGRLSLQRP